jgi:hypothetical protein
MPIIYSISGSYFNSASWNDTSVWDGGVVPTSSDQVYIRGVRTTINNSTGYQPWVGQQTIVVASTSSFPDSGSFYTYTDRDEEVKIDYLAVSASNRFLSCSIDTSYYSWSLDIYPVTESLPSKKGGLIPNGAYVQFRPGQIYIPSGSEVVLSTSGAIPALTIENGGDLLIRSSASFAPNGYVRMNDGFFQMTGSSLFRFNKNYPTASTETGNLLNTCGLYANNVPMQKIIIDGPEVRANTRLANSASVGDYYITVDSVANFAVEDPIFIGEDFLTQSRTDTGILPRLPYVNEVSSYDEVLEVTYKDTPNNRLYVKRVNGLEGKILATSSATEIIVDEERFQPGDKLLINNQYVTVVTSSVYDLELADYNFQSGSDLSAWETDITRSFYFNDWSLYPGLGLTQFTTTQYRHLFVKDTMLDNVKVEAWVSNLRNITRGSGSRGEYGIYIQAEPQSDYDYLSPISAPTGQPLRTAFVVDPQNARMYLRQKNYNNSIYSNIYTGSYAQDGFKKITLESTRGFIRAYVDDNLVVDDIARAGTIWGRVGLYSNGNNCLVCTRYKVYQKTSKVVLATPVTASIGDIIYETGIEYNHAIDNKVIKLFSTVVDPLEHVDYAFAYRGAAEYQTNNPVSGSTNQSGIFPYIFANQSTGSKNQNSSQFWRLVNDFNQTYNYGNNLTASVIIDFGKPVTFNKVAFLENLQTNLQDFTASFSIEFSGSNDITGSFITASNWTPLTSSIIDERKRTTSETYRNFDVGGPHTYRFLLIRSLGTTSTSTIKYNSFKGYRVRLNYSNSLQVNNASDLNIGDEVGIISRNNMNPFTNATNYSQLMFVSSSANTSSFLDNFTQHYHIVSKSAGNVIYLDQSFEEGSIEKGAYVVKLNKELNFSGSFAGTGSWCTGRIAVFGSSAQQPIRRMLFNNVGFQHLNGAYPYLSTSGNYTYGGFALQEQNWFNYMGHLQGCTFYNNFNFTSIQWYWTGRSGFANRHNVVSNMATIYQTGNAPSISAPVINTGNIFYGINSLDVSYANFSLQIFSYNFILGGNRILPNLNGNVGVYNYPYSTLYVMRRNSIEGVTGNFQPALSVDNIGTQYHFIVDNNRFGYVNNTVSTFYTYTFMDKAFNTPFLLPKRGGFDARRVTVTYNANSPLPSVLNYGTINAPMHYIGNYIKNYNRLGYDVWTNSSGWWVKKTNEEYYRYYRHTINGDWRNPILACNFYLEEGVSASLDLNFNYYQTPNIVWQNEQIASGSIYMMVTKNGAEVETISGSGFTLNTLPKSLTPTSFSKIYTFTGPGHFQVAMAGMLYYSGFTAFNNIASRLNISEPERAQVFSNTFNMRYFDRGDKWLAKTMYTQPTDGPKFRLKGSRIF